MQRKDLGSGYETEQVGGKVNQRAVTRISQALCILVLKIVWILKRTIFVFVPFRPDLNLVPEPPDS